jgi:hypothetical protein
MTLRLNIWQLDLIVAISVLCIVVSCWLLRATRMETQSVSRKHLVGVERELVVLPLAGALFRLFQQLAFTAFALVLWTVKHPGDYALLSLYIVGQGTMPFHSYLLLLRQRRANRRIPPPAKET